MGALSLAGHMSIAPCLATSNGNRRRLAYLIGQSIFVSPNSEYRRARNVPIQGHAPVVRFCILIHAILGLIQPPRTDQGHVRSLSEVLLIRRDDDTEP